MNILLISAGSMGIMGALFALGLAKASNKFAVEEDPRVGQISEVLPGANCGACGYPGCDAFASAVARDQAPVNGCPVGGSNVAQKVAALMGVEAINEEDKKVARVSCQGTKCNAKEKFKYEGIQDCRAAARLNGGSKSCEFGCLGLGTCEKVCAFDAITIEDGIAKIDPNKCTACGKCIDACPKTVIQWIPFAQQVIVDCNSSRKGKEVKEKCIVGCIGCKICVKACPFDAMKFKDNLAYINYERCTNCMICAEKCPTKAICTNFSQKENVYILDS
jgi:Na+-translocating ferredoxin:NAD+ oxidoreductase RNF subunit RnfB